MIEFRTDWTSNGVLHFNVSMYWIDPKHLLTPTDEINNVIELKIRGIGIPEEFAMRQNDWDLTYLENLKLRSNGFHDDGISSANFIPMLSRLMF